MLGPLAERRIRMPLPSLSIVKEPWSSDTWFRGLGFRGLGFRALGSSGVSTRTLAQGRHRLSGLVATVTFRGLGFRVYGLREKIMGH